MNKRTSWISGIAGVVLLTGTMAACSKTAEPSGDLARDLNAAASNSNSALTLAPVSGSRDVVSAIEQSPEVRPARTTPKLKSGPQRPEAAPPPPAVVPQSVAAAPTAAVATVPTATAPAVTPAVEPPSASPRPTPMQPARTGRYKTEAEVIRDAPFPIKP